MMDFSDGYVSKEHRELIRCASESIDPFSSVSPVNITISTEFPMSPRSSKSPRSPKVNGKHSPKNEKHSHSPKQGRPKKGGAGGKGTWGGLLDTTEDDKIFIDPSDPNYDSTQEYEQLETPRPCTELDEYKKKVTTIIAEYFDNDDIASTAEEIEVLGKPYYRYYIVKKLISMAMDRHDKQKEMAARFLSTIYGTLIDPGQTYKGFKKLVESADDLIVDIPDTVDVLALFIARAVVDDILPPAFVTKQIASLPEDSKGVEVLQRVGKSYLACPHHAEIIEQRWGGSENKTVENVKHKINNLLVEYITSGDMKEACRCMKELNVPFFHHEIVKRALTIAMERPQAEGLLLGLLKEVFEEGLINSSQMTKGFNRVIDTIDDLSLDVPNARKILKSLITKATSEGWLSASSLKIFSLERDKKVLEDGVAKDFKVKAQNIISEYFLSGDIFEVRSCLELENGTYSIHELKAIFVKRLITSAMDRKNREKEMASVLLSSLGFSADDVVNGFAMLMEAADDTVLDNPIVVEDLALFLARAVVDEALAPQHLEEIAQRYSGSEATANKVLQLAKSVLKARLSGERILRCWGGGGSNAGQGWAVEDVKDRIVKLLEEYECGGDIGEACRCIKELGVPFFHHEVVKKAMVIIIEKKNDNRMWKLLEVCFDSGLVTLNQMSKGFERVVQLLDDLCLDVPDAQKRFSDCMERAKAAGWLDDSFSFTKSGDLAVNGTSPLN